MPKKIYKKDFREVVDGLSFAWEQLRKHPRKNTRGSNDETINTFSKDYTAKLLELKNKLIKGTFKFSPLRRVMVEKGREILVYRVDERILAISILKSVFPRLEHLNSNHDFSRKGLYIVENEEESEEPEFEGTPLAVEKIQTYLNQGYVWVFEADIKKFFDNVPKQKIFNLIKRYIKNKEVIELIRQIIYFSVESSSESGAKDYPPTKGVAQGSSLSPILASIYLYEFDMYICGMPDVKLVRYVDDFIVLCKDEATAKKMYELVKRKLKGMEVDIYELGEKHKTSGLEKTKITLARGYGANAFDFLGLTFNNTDVDISQKKKDEIDKKIKEIIHSTGTNFLKKTKSIESRLNGYIDHYKKAHYSRTVASLVKIISSAEKELRSYYITIYTKITKRHPFSKLTPEIGDRLFHFMGIDFANIEREVKKPISTKKFIKQ
jgi:retron-type reverse transcriptase